MKLSKDLILSSIIEHKSAFMPIIDYINSNEGTHEFHAELYIDSFRDNVETKYSTDDQKVVKRLTLNSLVEHGIFTKARDGIFEISSFIVEMLRYLDTSRIKELSGHQFETIRENFERSCYQLEECSLERGQDLADIREQLNGLVADTRNKVQQNVAALKANADRIAEEFEQRNSGTPNSQVAHGSKLELLFRVRDLIDRYVAPCLQFINPNLDMRGRRLSLADSFNRIREYYEKHNFPNYELSILFNKRSIFSYYEDISVIMDQLERYYKALDQERVQYSAIEKAFNELFDEVVELRHDSEKNKFLSNDLPIFHKLSVYLGLHTHKSSMSKRLSWHSQRIGYQFNEWLRSVDHIKPKPSKPILIEDAPPNPDKERARELNLLTLGYDWPDQCNDLQLYIQNWLKNELTDYSLGDVLHTLQIARDDFKQAAGLKHLSFSTEKKSMSDGVYLLNYLPVQITKGQEHV